MSQTDFTGIDSTIIISYLLLLFAVGFCFSREQQSRVTFMRGRQKMMGWLTLGVSSRAVPNSGLSWPWPTRIGVSTTLLVADGANRLLPGPGTGLPSVTVGEMMTL